MHQQARGDALVANGLDQFAATTSAELAGVISDETGSGALVFGTSPTLVTPALGTPASGVMTNVTGTATGLTTGATNALKSATTTVDVSAATAPTTGQVLKATSATTATWQAEAGGGLSNVIEDTTPQLGGMLDVNGQAIGDGTLELLTFTETGSAVNQINVANAATGNGPSIAAEGETNVDLNISTAGTGEIVQTAAGTVQRNGNFSTAGDAQSMTYVLRGTSNGDFFSEIFLDGSSTKMVLPDDTTWAFDALIVARLGTTQASAAYNVFGCIDNESGTVAMVGSVQYGTPIEDNPAGSNWDVQFTADDTNNSLKLEVKGGGFGLPSDLHWVANVRVSQVTYATNASY